MKLIDPRTTYILTNPANFAWRVLRSFQANQGLLRAGAVAYYALLSVLPLLILTAIALSHVMGWYLGTLSQLGVVYGSLTTAIVVLLSLELAATLLLGAQMIAESEHIKIGAP